MQLQDDLPMSLGKMRGYGVREIEVYCCGHEEKISVDGLVDELLVPCLRLRLRCARCGRRPQMVRPAWGEPRDW
jgi:hypothetical protein